MADPGACNLNPFHRSTTMERMADKNFRGMVFCDKIETGRSAATLTTTELGIEARASNGQVFHIPYGQMKLVRNEASSKVFSLQPVDKSFTLVCYEKGLLKEIQYKAPSGAKEKAQKLSQTNKSRSMRIGGLIAAALFCIVVFVLLIPTFFNALIFLIPEALDEQIGALAKIEMQMELTELKDAVVQGAADQLLATLMEKVENDDHDWPFEVIVVANGQVNAFALPGGTMVFFSGLLKNADSAEEVAGVMAHEMGHVTNRHALKRIIRTVGTLALIRLVVGDADGLIRLAAEIINVASSNSYSQGQEREADETSVGLMHKSGLNPMALTEYFYRLREEQGEVPVYLNWLSSHPSHSDRIKAIEKITKDLPAAVVSSLDIDWTDIKNRL